MTWVEHLSAPSKIDLPTLDRAKFQSDVEAVCTRNKELTNLEQEPICILEEQNPFNTSIMPD